jgi:hypothetical protein
VLIWLGLYPQPVFDAAHPALASLQRLAYTPVQFLAGSP